MSVGYPKGVKDYKEWRWNEDRFSVSPDVVFSEDSRPSKSSQLRANNVDRIAIDDIVVAFYVEDYPMAPDGVHRRWGDRGTPTVAGDDPSLASEAAASQPTSIDCNSVWALRRSEKIAKKRMEGKACHDS